MVLTLVEAASDGNLRQIEYSYPRYYFVDTFSSIYDYKEEEGVKQLVEYLTREKTTIRELK